MWGWSIGCISTTKICKMSFFQIVTPFPTSPKISRGFHQPIFFRCVHVYVHWVQHGTVLYGVKTIVTSWTKSIHRYRWWLDMAIDNSKYIAWPVEIDLLKLSFHTSCTYWMAGYYLDIPTWKLPRRFHVRKKNENPTGVAVRGIPALDPVNLQQSNSIGIWIAS